MSQCVYGVWDGVAIDARRDRVGRPRPPLDGLNDLTPGTSPLAFVADRGFLVMDEGVCLAHAFADYMAWRARRMSHAAGVRRAGWAHSVCAT